MLLCLCHNIPIREVVITSVLDEAPPCVGVGGAMQDTTCLISQMNKIYWPENLSWDFHIRFHISKVCIFSLVSTPDRVGLYKQDTIF